MKLQLIHHANRILGLTLIFRKTDHILGVLEVEEVKPEPQQFWRICDACTVNEAMVFCRSHTKYLCEFCLALHNNQPEFCEYLSMTAARELILQRVKNEAHT